MIRQSLKDYMSEHGPFYAPISICPLEYHGYRKDKPKIIDEVIEEIEYELSIFPEHADNLLDKINDLKTKRKNIPQ